MYKLTKQDFIEYAEDKGKQAAADLLLLAGPDGYGGTYDEYLELEKELREETET